jgi:small conductance mechanosensitive channel
MEKWFFLVRDKLTAWLELFFKMLPNLLLAILIFCAFFFLAKYLRKFVYKLLLRISHQPAVSDFSQAYFLSLFYLQGFL